MDVGATLGRSLSRRKRPAVGQCVDGYAAWAEIALGVWEAPAAIERGGADGAQRRPGAGVPAWPSGYRSGWRSRPTRRFASSPFERRRFALMRNVGGTQADRHSRLGPCGAALLVVGAAIAAYLPALANGFVWDDPLILDDQLPAFHSCRDVFFPPHALPHAGSFYYRPVVFLTYLADRWLGGGSPVMFHATPIVVHALASGLLLMLIWQLLGRRGWLAPAMGALVFAVHPVHAEVAAWLAGRSDSLAAVGVLAALLAWGQWLQGRHPVWLVGGMAALFFGLLAKESALPGAVLGAALPWVWPLEERPGRPAIASLWGAIGVTLCGYVALRAVAVGLAPGAALAIPPAQLVRHVFDAVAFYAGTLLWPTRPGVVLTSVPHAPGTLAIGLGTTALVGLALGVALYRRAAVVAWGLAWVVLAYLPALLLAARFISETPVAERYSYLPSAGGALLVACAVAARPSGWERTVRSWAPPCRAQWPSSRRAARRSGTTKRGSGVTRPH